jgi:hypothetical protein
MYAQGNSRIRAHLQSDQVRLQQAADTHMKPSDVGQLRQGTSSPLLEQGEHLDHAKKCIFQAKRRCRLSLNCLHNRDQTCHQD